MPQVKYGSTILVHYTGMTTDGTIFDSTAGEDPLRLTVGEGDILPGFEEALVGMSPGESKKVKVPPEKGYGSRDKSRVTRFGAGGTPLGEKPEVTRSEFIGNPGTDDAYTGRFEEGRLILDGNHPLAGKELVFDIDLVDILS